MSKCAGLETDPSPDNAGAPGFRPGLAAQLVKASPPVALAGFRVRLRRAFRATFRTIWAIQPSKEVPGVKRSKLASPITDASCTMSSASTRSPRTADATIVKAGRARPTRRANSASDSREPSPDEPPPEGAGPPGVSEDGLLASKFISKRRSVVPARSDLVPRRTVPPAITLFPLTPDVSGSRDSCGIVNESSFFLALPKPRAGLTSGKRVSTGKTPPAGSKESCVL